MSDIPSRFDPLLPERPWTVCFYSFRGGVGRTTLAVSTALSLPSLLRDKGKGQAGVCMLDFDLEAPGVDEFELLRPPDREKQRGLVEYVRSYSAAVANAESVEHGYADAELSDHVYAVGEQRIGIARFTCEEKAKWEAHRGRKAVEEEEYDLSFMDDTDGPTRDDGRRQYGLMREKLKVMRAGLRDREYRKFLAEFNWHKFYQAQDGYLFFENMRAGIKKELNCDYLIIDSRTGITHIGGVCIGHLADCVVLVFQPSTAHKQGLADIVQVIKDREKKENRPIPRLYAATKIPHSRTNTMDDESIKAAKDIVEFCEGAKRERIVWKRSDALSVSVDHDWPEFNFNKAHLFLFSWHNLSNAHIPDSFLTSMDSHPDGDESDNEAVTWLLSDAICDARAAVERTLNRAASRSSS